MRVRKQNFKRMFNLFLCRAAAHVKEIGWAAAGVLNNVHRRHRQARAVHHAGNRAIQLDVIQRVLAGLDFQRVFLRRVAQSLDVRMTEQRVIVERDLRVQRKQLVVLGGDEWIDLHQRSVRIHERLVKALEECHRVVDLRRLQPQGKGQLARLPCAKAHRRIDRLLENGVRILRRHFLNLHAARL